MEMHAIGSAVLAATGNPGARRERAATEGSAPTMPADTGAVQDLPLAVEALSRAAAAMSRDVVFTIDSESSQPIVRVVDRETQQVIRQLPSEEALEIARALDRMQGLILRRRA